MSDLEGYVVPCWKCAKKFDVEVSLWCDCDGKLRTLECPHCGSCFCQSTFQYRRDFWNNAPSTLREHTARFRLAGRVVATLPGERAGAASETLLQPHVLIVDDEEPIRSLAACYVEQIGYRVTTVAGPQEALLLAEQVAFDVVLTDALMPKMDGRELCRRLKEAHGSRLKVVLMTALYTARHFQTESRNVFKVDEHIAKPLRYDTLRDALHRVAPLAQPRIIANVPSANYAHAQP
jgi:CheY-like chemotaxis protein